MPRGTRRRKPAAEEEEGEDEDGIHLHGVTTTATKADLNAAIAALLHAVAESRWSLMNLFGEISSNNNNMSASHPSLIRDGISMREQRQLLMQSIPKMSPAQTNTFFTALKDLVVQTIDNQEHVPESAFDDTMDDDAMGINNCHENNDDHTPTIVPDTDSSHALAFLARATRCAQSYVAAAAASPKTPPPASGVPSPVYETACVLHDCLAELEASCGPDAAPTMQAIVSLCETWWVHDLTGKEQLIVQALPILALGAMNNVGKLKRLYAIRTAFHVIDWDDGASHEFRNLLLRVASAPATVKITEGKKLLSFLLTLEGSSDAAMLTQMHASIRTQIPYASKSVLTAFGEIYYRAWTYSSSTQNTTTGSNPPIQQRLEELVLQDITYASLHLANPTNVLVVLESFFAHKQHPATQDLLYRLYGPVLWRALTAANAKVRSHAARVLAAVFPLLGPTARTATASVPSSPAEHVKKCCVALKALLRDPDPRVRVAGSEAVAQALVTYWDVIPTGAIRSLLNVLVAEHASDVSSSVVRVGAIHAVTKLLEAPQSHAVLRELLPSLGNLIHDRVDKARLSVVRMLLAVKNLTSIKFFHVVHPDHLIARLAEEGKNGNPTNAVASALTGLMRNSFFPHGPNVTGLEQVKRTVTFLKEDPDAAGVFYANLSGHVNVDTICTLTVKLLRCLHNAVQSEQAHESKQRARTARGKRYRTTVSVDVGLEDEENNSEEGISKGQDGLPTAADTEVMARLAETICTLWQSIEKELQRDEVCGQFLVKEFSGAALTNALHFFEQKASTAEEVTENVEEATLLREDCHRTSAALLRCAGRLPVKAVEGLVPYISSVLTSVDDTDNCPVESVTSHVALLCLWNMADEVATSLATSIQSECQNSNSDLFVSPVAARSKKRRSVRSRSSDAALDVPQLPTHVALATLETILRGSDPSSVAARGVLLASKPACRTIEMAFEEGTKHAERVLSGIVSVTDANVEYVLRVCELYGRFLLHKEAAENDLQFVTFGLPAQQLLHWTTSFVVPALTRSDTGSLNVPFDANVSSIHVEKSFDIITSPESASRSRRRVNRNRTPERLNDGIGQQADSPSDEDVRQSASRRIRAFAIALLQSSCTIFSEWLAVGGSGASLIAQGAVSWCRVFDAPSDAQSQHEELLPAFCRLALELAKSTGDCALLKQLLTKCDTSATTDLDDTSYVRQTLALLFSTRSKQAPALISSVLKCVVESAYELLEKETDNVVEYELPATVGAFWTNGSGCIGSALVAILGSKAASLELGTCLVSSIPEHAQESARLALFDVQCLWMLCDADSGSKVSVEVAEKVRTLHIEGLNEDGLGGVMEELLAAVRV